MKEEKTTENLLKEVAAMNDTRISNHQKIETHFYSYFKETKNIPTLSNSRCSLKVVCGKDSEGYFVGFEKSDKNQSIESDYWEKLKIIGLEVGGTYNPIAAYYCIKSLKKILPDYDYEENLSQLFKEIDTEIEQFIKKFEAEFNKLD